MTSTLIDVPAVGRRVDPERIMELLAPALPRATQQIADQLGVSHSLKTPKKNQKARDSGKLNTRNPLLRKWPIRGTDSAVGRRVDPERIMELLAPALPRATQSIAGQLGVSQFSTRNPLPLSKSGRCVVQIIEGRAAVRRR